MSQYQKQPPYYGGYQQAGGYNPQGYPTQPPAYGFQHQPPPPPQGQWTQGAQPGGGGGQRAYYPPERQPIAHAAVHMPPEEDGRNKAHVGFTDQTIRHAFIRKTFAYVTIMLLVVTVLVALFTLHSGVRTFVTTSGWGLALYITSYVTFLAVYITISCCEGPRRQHPTNLVLLVLLTLSLGYMAAMIAAYHETTIVLMTAAITAVSCGAIVAFASQTKFDFTGCLGVMFVVSMVMMLFGIVAICVAIFAQSYLLYTVYSGLMALVFMVYLAIDVQMVMGGRKYEISPEDHVFAATQLFVDVVYIFLMLLQLIGGATRD